MNIKDLRNIVEEFYPDGVDFYEFEDIDHPFREKLKLACLHALEDYKWKDLKNDIILKGYNFLEFSLLFQAEPSHIGVIQVNNTDGCQLNLKISTIAKVYSLYFFNNAVNPKEKVLRFNSTNNEEEELLKTIQHLIIKNFNSYVEFEKEGFNILLENLGNLRLLNPRKPYLDECIYGNYMSIHS